MPRSLTTTQRTASRADHVIRAHLVELALDTGTLRFAQAFHNIKYGGHTWIGAGALGMIERIKEGVALEARGVRMALSGVPTALVAAALSELYAYRPCRIYVAFYHRDTNKLIDTPVLEWAGLISTMRSIIAKRQEAEG